MRRRRGRRRGILIGENLPLIHCIHNKGHSEPVLTYAELVFHITIVIYTILYLCLKTLEKKECYWYIIYETYRYHRRYI